METLHMDNCKRQLISLRDSLDVCGGKWKLFILIYLAANSKSTLTFLQIQREILKISAKVLSKELKNLEANLLIERIKKDTKPATVQYKITEHGRSILPVAEVLIKWGEKHRSKVLDF